MARPTPVPSAWNTSTIYISLVHPISKPQFKILSPLQHRPKCKPQVDARRLAMRVLLLGVTGRVGSRLLPALVAHNHTVVAYVRDPTKVGHDVASRTSSILTGCATDSDALTAAILSNHCDVVINAAGFAHVVGRGGDLPSIFSSVSRAAQAAKAKRGGPPLRCWFLSGWPLMDSPNKPHLIMD